MSVTLTMWWPSPETLSDLVVEDAEGGFSLSAPEDTECSAWLEYWSQSPEHQEFFCQQFLTVLTAYLKSLENGKAEDQPL